MHNYKYPRMTKEENNIIVDKSKKFAIRIIRLYQYVSKNADERVLTKQFLKSGTSIGANVREGIRGQTKADFAAKMNIALKEASETQYWLELLHETDYISDSEFLSINSDCTEILKILTSIVKTSFSK